LTGRGEAFTVEEMQRPANASPKHLFAFVARIESR
jgi:hypothetical protein